MAIADRQQALQTALRALEDNGLLLLSDHSLPSVVGIIADEPLHSSWWGHPLGGVIYHVSTALEDQPDVLATKLINGKVTYVHRRLWPAVVAVGRAREPWQVTGLSTAAQWLLAETDAEGEVQTNDLPRPTYITRLPQAARELEQRLLVCATEIHTPSGAHAKVLETWSHWAQRTGSRTLVALSLTDGKRLLQDAAARLGRAGGGEALLPWQHRRVRHM
jgi:hypothetical protein